MMKDWFSRVYIGFIVSSILSFLIAFFSEGITSYGAYISGYLILIIAIMLIILTLFNKILNNTTQEGTSFSSLMKVLSTSIPFLIMLFTIAFLFYIMIIYKDRIIDNQISPSYYSFNNINIILLLIQIYLVYEIITSKEFETAGIFPKLTANIVVLLGILGMISSINIFIILKYYTTDGFTTIS